MKRARLVPAAALPALSPLPLTACGSGDPSTSSGGNSGQRRACQAPSGMPTGGPGRRPSGGLSGAPSGMPSGAPGGQGGGCGGRAGERSRGSPAGRPGRAESGREPGAYAVGTGAYDERGGAHRVCRPCPVPGAVQSSQWPRPMEMSRSCRVASWVTRSRSSAGASRASRNSEAVISIWST